MCLTLNKNISFFHDFSWKHWNNSSQNFSDQLNLKIFIRKRKRVNAKLFFPFLVSSLIFRNCLGAKGLKFNSIINMILSFVKSEWLWAIFSRNENQSESCCFEMIRLSTARGYFENKRLFLDILFELRKLFTLISNST